MKTNLLKSERVKKGLTQKMISKNLEIDVTSYSKKENGIIEFKASEIKAIKNILNLTPDKVVEIFFDEKLEFNSSQYS
ncbi:helix-turn-helix transcriptional regulator [Clostridium tertium]|uniref:helix-turn-helix domain-containing protein n=1 Tax=Clostridium TaxID=1485 RepID=UPI00232D22CF|nr:MULTISPECIES: helix-turn-helix transcriptional regulator [Clostridium]MDB1923351.1 helix-turn-helix transcriptional regulator [Clostridium tertium]MDB1929956.1 helix-turn-helix transcriptional regulator [Clostridium tertium]MDU7948745.1 helix-turn-helix transcriptional regulator [Clostridium sp.]